MAAITIAPYNSQTGEGTLSFYANQYKTDIPTLQKLNPGITDINKIQAGANLNVPDTVVPINTNILNSASTTPLVKTGSPYSSIIASSDQARNQFNENATILQNKESQIVPPAQTPVNIQTANPSLKGLVDNANNLITQFQSQGGVITPQIQTLLDSINNSETQKMSSMAGARTATDEKDAKALNNAITTAKEAEKTQQATINQLITQLGTARADYLGSLTPTVKEGELRTKLNTLRTERQLLPLELRKEGISAQGIASREVSDERVRSIQEQNLLLELGLEQDARTMKSGILEKQVDYIGKDIDLQQKIQDKIQEQENKVLEQVRNLHKDSISALSNIVNSFKGLALEDMDAETQGQLFEMARANGIPFNLLTGALKTAKQQQVFDNAIKTSQENRLKESDNKNISLATIKYYADQVKSGAIYLENVPSESRNKVAEELSKTSSDIQITPDGIQYEKGADGLYYKK